MNKYQMAMNDLCITELANVLNQIRKITINEYEKIKILQDKIEEIKKTIAKSRS